MKDLIKRTGTTLLGMERVNESSQLETAERSQFCLPITGHYQAELTNETRFGAAFMMDTGSSTGEILGHSKVCLSSNLVQILGFSVKTTPSALGHQCSFYQTPEAV